MFSTNMISIGAVASCLTCCMAAEDVRLKSSFEELRDAVVSYRAENYDPVLKAYIDHPQKHQQIQQIETQIYELRKIGQKAQIDELKNELKRLRESIGITDEVIRTSSSNRFKYPTLNKFGDKCKNNRYAEGILEVERLDSVELSNIPVIVVDCDPNWSLKCTTMPHSRFLKSDSEKTDWKVWYSKETNYNRLYFNGDIVFYLEGARLFVYPPMTQEDNGKMPEYEKKRKLVRKREAGKARQLEKIDKRAQRRQANLQELVRESQAPIFNASEEELTNDYKQISEFCLKYSQSIMPFTEKIELDPKLNKQFENLLLLEGNLLYRQANANMKLSEGYSVPVKELNQFEDMSSKIRAEKLKIYNEVGASEAEFEAEEEAKANGMFRASIKYLQDEAKDNRYIKALEEHSKIVGYNVDKVRVNCSKENYEGIPHVKYSSKPKSEEGWFFYNSKYEVGSQYAIKGNIALYYNPNKSIIEFVQAKKLLLALEKAKANPRAL